MSAVMTQTVCRGCKPSGSSFYVREGERLLVINAVAFRRHLVEGRVSAEKLNDAIFLFMESEEQVLRALSVKALCFDHCCEECAVSAQRHVNSALEMAELDGRLSFHPMDGCQAVDWEKNEESWDGVAARLRALKIPVPPDNGSGQKPYHKVAYSETGFALTFSEFGRIVTADGQRFLVV